MNTEFIEPIDIDLSRENLPEAELTLHKPDLDRTQIANLSEAFEIEHNIKALNVDELTFRLPIEIDKHNKLVENDNIDLVKYRYLVKLKRTDNNTEKWFQIRDPQKEMETDGDYKTVYCYSLEIELSDRLLRSYDVTSYNCSQVLEDAVHDTNWSIDWVAGEFDTTFRSFDVTSKTRLNFILEDVVETFNCYVKFDTENRKISVYNPKDLGHNLGLTVGYGKLLESLNLSYEDKNHATRAEIRGADNISIQSQVPTGTSYLESFDYFLYPFERDENGNTIKSSDYMSDNLCHAILDYNELLDDKQGEFESLLSEKETLEDELTTLENELFDLQQELFQIQDEIDIKQANNEDASDLLQDEQNKQDEIDAKETEIDNKQSEINDVNNNINDLREEVSLENNFTQEQLKERAQYVIAKEVSNQYIDDPKELLKWGKEQFDDIISPQIKLNIDIVNLLKVAEEKRNHRKLNLLDYITVFHEKLNINMKAKITEINIRYDDDNIDLQISNVERIDNDKDKFLKDLNRSISTSTRVDLSKFKWDGVDNNKGEINELINILQGEIAKEVNMAVNEDVQINRRGITIREHDNPDRFLRATSGVLGITRDSGNTYQHAITADGCINEKIKFNKIKNININL